MKMQLPLLLVLSLLFGTEIACSGQFLHHDTRHGSTAFRTSMPVDAAFTRIKKALGLSSWERKNAKTQSRSGKSSTDTISFRSNRDVDIVAGRIKREFGYKTRQQVLDSRDGGYKIHATAFRYDVQPGAYYEMAGAIIHRYDGRIIETGVRVLIEREGSGSQIEFTFKSGDDRLGPSLVARAKRAIRR